MQFDHYRLERSAAEFGIAAIQPGVAAAAGHAASSTTWSGHRNIVRSAAVDDPHLVRIVPVRHGGTVVSASVSSAQMEIIADGRRTECAPGVLVLECASQVLEERLVERGSVATVRVDRDDLQLSDRTLEAAVTDDVGRERWQASFVTAVTQTITGLGADASPPDLTGVDRYAAGVIELLIRSIAGARMDAVPVDPDRRRQVAEEFIELHLLDPTLSAQTVASYLRLSARQLARDLDGGPSVAVMILRARLRHADRLLRNPAHSELMLAQIAQICHFSSPARFSHAYKEHFGVTPRDVRAAAQAHRRAQR